MINQIVLANNLVYLKTLPSESIDLIYIDPPFNTGKVQKRTQIKTIRDLDGDRVGFQEQSYKTTALGTTSFEDSFEDYIGFLKERCLELYRVLKKTGSFFLHLDYREIHYAKIMLDGIFGRDCFINEIIWSYDYGAKSRKKWSAKHDNLLWYAKDPKNYTFNWKEIDRIPYMAPGLVGTDKAAKGKVPTDSWFITIVPTNSKEKTGYATQKPLKLLERIVKVHSNPGDFCLDAFAGSGSFGEAAAKNGRNFIMIDSNLVAFEIMRKRLHQYAPKCFVFNSNK